MSGEQTTDLPSGRSFDQFRIVRTLGRGGMGVVYEAEDTLLNRRVAIKTLTTASPADAAASALLREAQAAARLEHPNVVRVYHVGRWDGGLYLVMELARGGSLQPRVNPDRPMRWETAVRAVAQACRGLAAAHAAGFVHRDIKPANLMLDDAGRVKVADFGLVRGGDLTTTATGRVAGTPHYMSPEQCRGDPADVRSDVYALGATLYALLVGRPPFPLPTQVQVMFAHCTLPPPDPRAAVPALPPGCGEVIRTAMAKEPAGRYQTATALYAALKALTANPAGSESVSPAAATVSPSDTVVPLPLPPGETVGWEQFDTTKPVRLRSPRRGGPRRLVIWALIAGVLAVVALGVTAVAVAVGLRWSDGGTPTTPSASPSTNRVVERVGSPFVPDIPAGGRSITLGGSVRAVAFSPDGKWMAAGGSTGAVVWDTTDAKAEYRLKWGDVTSLACSRCTNDKGEEVAVLYGGYEAGSKIWFSDSTADSENVEGWGGDRVRAVAVKEGWQSALGCGGETLRGEVRMYVFPGGSGRPSVRTTSGAEACQLAFAPGKDDRTLAVVDADGNLELFDSGSGERKRSPPLKSPGRQPAIAFHPTTGHLGVALGDRFTLWDRAKHEHAGEWMRLPVDGSGEGPAVHALAFSPDGKYAATADTAGNVTLWDVTTGKLLRTLTGGSKPTRCVAFRPPDGRVLAAGGDDGNLRVWDVTNELK